MDNSETDRSKPGEPVYPRSHRLIRRLSILFGAATLAVAAFLLAALLPAGVGIRSLAQELISGGLAAAVLAALLLSVTGLLGTLALTTARFRESVAVESGRTTAMRGWRDVLEHPGLAARLAQAVIAPVGAVLIYLVLRLLWPTTLSAEDGTAANIAAAFIFALTFVALVAERVMADFPEP